MTTGKREDLEQLCEVAFKTAAVDHLRDFWQSGHDLRSQNRADITETVDWPACGWILARRLARHGRTPAILNKPEWRWPRKAVAYLAGGDRSKDPEFGTVDAALKLEDNPDERAVLRAALLALDSTSESVAAALGLPQPVVEAYEALFFSVLARKTDHTYRLRAAGFGLTRKGGPRHMSDSFDALHNELFQAACHGNLQDVLDVFGGGGGNSGKASGEPLEAVAENLMRDVMAVAVDWMTANRRSATTVPPALVKEGIDIARRAASLAAPDAADRTQTVGEFGRLAYEALDEGVRRMRKEIAAKAGLLDPNCKPPPAPAPAAEANDVTTIATESLLSRLKPDTFELIVLKPLQTRAYA